MRRATIKIRALNLRRPQLYFGLQAASGAQKAPKRCTQGTFLKPAGAIWKTSGCHLAPVCAKVSPKRRLGTPGVSMYGTSVSIHRIWGAHLGGNCHQRTPKGGHLGAHKLDLSAQKVELINVMLYVPKTELSFCLRTAVNVTSV